MFPLSLCSVFNFICTWCAAESEHASARTLVNTVCRAGFGVASDSVFVFLRNNQQTLQVCVCDKYMIDSVPRILSVLSF